MYNGEKFLKKRIDSILNQTFKNFELIISDNASSDETKKICEEYTKQDSRIQYIHQKKILVRLKILNLFYRMR